MPTTGEAVAALAAVATARFDALEEEVLRLRGRVEALEQADAERRGRESTGARLIPWLALAASGVSAAHAAGLL